MNKGRLCKLVNEILQNPGNVKFQRIQILLEEFGFDCRQPKKGSRHYVFRKSGIRMNISIPKERPVGKVYVKQVIEILELEEWYETNC